MPGKGSPSRRPGAIPSAALIASAAAAMGCVRTDVIRYLELPPRPAETIAGITIPPPRVSDIGEAPVLPPPAAGELEAPVQPQARRAAPRLSGESDIKAEKG